MRYMRNAIRPVEFIDCTTRDQMAVNDTLLRIRSDWKKAKNAGWNARAANLEMLHNDLYEYYQEEFSE